MTYAIIRHAAPPPSYAPPKTEERVTMEKLEVGDAFMVETVAAWSRCRYARYEMKPRKFTVRKVGRQGWQVRRTA